MYRLDHTKYLNERESSLLRLKLKRMSLDRTLMRNALLIELVFYTGCRKQEALNVRWDDIDEASQTVYIRGLKGSNDRQIPLPKEYLARLLRLDRKGERIFPICRQRFDQIWRSVRPVKKGIKSLRHSFALRLYRHTRDIMLVKAALGHKAIQNTEIYLSYVYEQETMKKAILGSHIEAS